MSLASLQDHRKIATVGVRCNGCGHSHSWPIEELIARYKSWEVVAVFKMWLAGCAAVCDRAVAGCSPVVLAIISLSELTLLLVCALGFEAPLPLEPAQKPAE